MKVGIHYCLYLIDAASWGVATRTPHPTPTPILFS